MSCTYVAWSTSTWHKCYVLA